LGFQEIESNRGSKSKTASKTVSKIFDFDFDCGPNFLLLSVKFTG